MLPLLLLPLAFSQTPTSVEQNDNGWQLLRGGQPYFIKGAGGRGRMEELKSAGGNSIRTWHSRDMGKTLDRAHALGLTVTMGIWLGHERHGFDYSDAAAVAKQKEHVHKTVLEHKDHPALLMWGIGNEMEGDGRNPQVWRAVNDIARMIKELDPNHPTMTVIAGVWPDKITQFNQHCPDIDLVGINAYGGLIAVPDEAKKQGLTRPYVVTEFGPTGWWESPKTPWDIALEPSSTAKAETYHKSYQIAIAKQPGWCLGCYAFLWGHKQEHTRTWFGLFLPEGERTAAIDVLTKEWTGQWPRNRCPRLERIEVQTTSGHLMPVKHHKATANSELQWHVVASDPENDPLTIRWEIRPESTDKKSGGDAEQAPQAISGAVLSTGGTHMVARMPPAGQYRVFVYITDGHGNAATGNVPVLVE